MPKTVVVTGRPGFTLPATVPATCDECAADVTIAPSTAQAIAKNRTNVTLLCWPCAVRLVPPQYLNPPRGIREGERRGMFNRPES